MSRVALVTGGSRGLGASIVEALVEDGWTVALTFRQSREEAEKLAGNLGAARAFQLDLADRSRPKALVAEIDEQLGPIGGLVNNAGVAHSGLLAMTSDAQWDRVIDINLSGAFRLCRAVLPGMTRQRRGAIVNVASLGAERAVAGQSAYAASKAGLLALTRTLAREMGRRDIRVNAVVPGYVATDMTADLNEQARAALRAAECLPSGTSPRSVAAAVAFLLSDRADAVSGQSLHVDAGASA